MFNLNPFNFTKVAAVQDPAGIDWGNITSPIIGLIDSLLGPALLVIGSVGAIFCIIVGVKFAKADEQQEREKAKGSLKNAAIGFLLIFIMIAVLKLGIGPLSQWVQRFQVNMP